MNILNKIIKLFLTPFKLFSSNWKFNETRLKFENKTGLDLNECEVLPLAEHLPKRQIDLFIGIPNKPDTANIQSEHRLLRRISFYSRPPLVASPYCSTGYLTASRAPIVRNYTFEIAKRRMQGKYKLLAPGSFDKLDPKDIVDYPSVLLTESFSPERKLQMRELYDRVKERSKHLDLKIMTPSAPLMYSEKSVIDEVTELAAMGVPREAIDSFLLVGMNGLVNNELDRKKVMRGVVCGIKNDVGNWLDHIPECPDNFRLLGEHIRLYLKIALYRTHLRNGKSKNYSFLYVTSNRSSIEEFVKDYAFAALQMLAVENKNSYICYSDAKKLAVSFIETGSFDNIDLNWYTEELPSIAIS